MRIIVTGGAGFIGSHIVDAYLAKGHEVFVVDDLSTGSKTNLHKKATLYVIDLVDPALRKVLAEISPDVVSHHAAQMNLRRSVEDPLFDARTNILGLLNVLEACKGLKVKKILFASSGGAVYGEQEKFPAAEDHPTRPLSPYGVSKITGEHYLYCYQSAFGIPYTALRYSNVYGPRQNSEGEAGVVAIFIRQLLDGRSPTINGDGKQTRDYVYVDDVVAANVAALESSFSGSLNIGTGKETTVLTIFSLLRDGLGVDIAALHGPAKVGEQERSCIDASRAGSAFGWTARTRLEEGLRETIAFYRQAGPA